MTLRQLFALTVTAAIAAHAQKRLPLNDGDPPFMLEDGWKPLLNGKDLSGWAGQDGKAHQWFTTAGVRWEPSGTILNSSEGRTANLVTLEKSGDTELYLEFMLAKGSNSGVYLHGLYEIQIFDSFGYTEAMRTSDGGAVYHRWIDERAWGAHLLRATRAAAPANGSPTRSRGPRPRGIPKYPRTSVAPYRESIIR